MNWKTVHCERSSELWQSALNGESRSLDTLAEMAGVKQCFVEILRLSYGNRKVISGLLNGKLFRIVPNTSEAITEVTA